MKSGYREIPEWNASDCARFWSKAQVGKEDECWNWTACVSAKGYGQFIIGGRRGMTLNAQRFAWAVSHGVRQVPMHVLHHCDNPRCVNPSHLFLGDDALNVADCVSKGRQAKGMKLSKARIGKMPRGTAHHAARLTDSDVQLIRHNYAGGGTTWKQLAEQFGVSPSAIQAIIEGRTWKHLR